MRTSEERIICVGIMVADLIGRPLHAFPEAGRLVLVDEMHLHTGGCAVNAASVLAQLDLPVEVVGKVGQDPLGDFLISKLRERGVDMHGVARTAESGTSATMVMVDPDGERRFVHCLGANRLLTRQDIHMQQLTSAAIVHIAGSLVLPGLDGEPTADLLKACKSAGVTTFLDTVWDDTGRWMSLLQSALPYVDYFVPSLPEAQALTGERDPQNVAQRLLEAGVNTVALKMGGEGCFVMDQAGTRFQLPAFDVPVVDATGAGDAFAGGFIAGVWHGWSLEKTARFANATGALCVMGMGASGSVRPLGETLSFMEKTPTKKLNHQQN